MSKKINLLFLPILLFSSFMFFTSFSNAGVSMPYEPPPYEPKSNCCEPRAGHGGCETWLQGVRGGICCDPLPDRNSQNAFVNPCCEPEYASQNALCVQPIEIPTGDGDDWGDIGWGDDDDDDDSFAGCDDNTCENTVCQREPSCCMSAIPVKKAEELENSYILEEPSGWTEECAFLANQFCEVCEGTPPQEVEKDSDGDPFQLYSVVDLRERESFVQVTNVSASPVTIHVQVFDVSNLCNENNFYDVYTGNDTHIYDMRNLTTNDGNPAGFVLPENAYGIFVVTVVDGVGGPTIENSVLVGNFRIVDNAGYEYRTNMLGIRSLEPNLLIQNSYFNYNIKGNVTLSDVIGIPLVQDVGAGEVVANPQQTFAGFDIDIYNLDEVPFSCRDITFSCTADTFEYGINDAIPHSRGKDVLCPSNVVPEGFVVLRPEESEYDNFVGYVGLNNGNGRGSMDSFWFDSIFTSPTFEFLLFPPGPF